MKCLVSSKLTSCSASVLPLFPRWVGSPCAVNMSIQKILSCHLGHWLLETSDSAQEYGAILLYTSNAIYKDLNQTLRDNNRGKLKKHPEAFIGRVLKWGLIKSSFAWDQGNHETKATFTKWEKLPGIILGPGILINPQILNDPLPKRLVKRTPSNKKVAFRLVSLRPNPKGHPQKRQPVYIQIWLGDKSQM